MNYQVHCGGAVEELILLRLSGITTVIFVSSVLFDEYLLKV